MQIQFSIFAAVIPFNLLLVSAGVLLFPMALTLCFWWALARVPESRKRLVWIAYRGYGQLIVTMTVAGWWILADLSSRYKIARIVALEWPENLDVTSVKSLLFWVPPIVSVGIFLVLCYRFDRTVLKLRWAMSNLVRRACWRLVSFVLPLLMVAAGFDSIFERRFVGIAWLVSAGIISRLGTAFFRRAEGMKFNRLRSGEIRNRALRMAKRMGLSLDHVYIVPAGKGHLTNAYGMSNAIALTDNLGKYLINRLTMSLHTNWHTSN